MSTIFTKIIKGEIPCYKIAEDDNYFAFLDINPVAKGHVLVVPKKEVDVFFELSDDLLEGIMPFCKKVAKAIESVVECDRIGLTVIGLEVPHAHVHLIPITNMGDMSFSKEKLKLNPKDFMELAQKIQAVIA